MALEQRGLAAATVDRRLTTLCGFYRFAHIDGRIGTNPAQYVRRPKVHPAEGRGMDRGELGRFLFTAETVSPAHAALAVLLGLNGPRVSEACATDIDDLGFERGHRTLTILGKGAKPAHIPLVPRAERTLDLAIDERLEGPILCRRDGKCLDRRTAQRWVQSIAKHAGLDLCIRTCCGRRSSWLLSTPASHCVTSNPRPVTLTRGPRPTMTGDARTSTDTRPMWSWPSS